MILRIYGFWEGLRRKEGCSPSEHPAPVLETLLPVVGCLPLLADYTPHRRLAGPPARATTGKFHRCTVDSNLPRHRLTYGSFSHFCDKTAHGTPV